MKIVAIKRNPPGISFPEQFPNSQAEWTFIQQLEELDACGEADIYIDLDFQPEERRVEILSRLLPKPVLINSVVTTIREIRKPFVRINAWPGFLERGVHELAVPSREIGDHISGIYRELGKAMVLAPDIPGMISARVLATIINEAYHTLQAGVSSREEIDTAMKLGTNYPFGPFEWSRRIGIDRIHGLLSELAREDSRYEPAGAMTEEVSGSGGRILKCD
jgi:3-hydroxybutyryl-CoA dehydrogenase